jgi:type II secretory pathway pseudopilin PulG
MLAVIIIGMIAAFAVPLFDKTVRKAEERSAILQLKKIHSRNLLEIKRTGHCIPGNIALSNTGLETDFGVSYGGMDYSYICVPGNANFTAQAVWPANSNGSESNRFILQLDESEVTDDAGAANPCCFSGPCQITPDC